MMGVARWVHFSLVVALVFGSGGALSEVYRWKDSSGKVHFGDRPDSTDPQIVKEIVLPSPNLAKGFKGTPSAAPAGPAKAVANDVPTPGSDDASKTTPQRGLARQGKDSCQARAAAFQASAACFDTCGRSVRTRRNNAGCEHCGEQPMPHC